MFWIVVSTSALETKEDSLCARRARYVTPASVFLNMKIFRGEYTLATVPFCFAGPFRKNQSFVNVALLK